MKSVFERRAEQLTRQLEDSRERVDDLVKDYREVIEAGPGQVRATAKETSANVAETLSGLTQNRPQWWIPVAVVAAIIIVAILARNLMSSSSNVT